MNFQFYRRIKSIVGSEACGNSVPPCDWERCELGDWRVVHVSEDAFTLWMGSKDEWMFTLSRPQAIRLGIWIVFHWWIWREWFGLRRWVWFWANDQECKRYAKTSIEHEGPYSHGEAGEREETP